MKKEKKFSLVSNYKPNGDQPKAIATLLDGLSSGLANQTLVGVTGSGKTFTIANIINDTQRPALILAHNKTLAAQLYGEFKSFFPNNAVEYFVSYYDYYQPEAYVPSSDTFIEKDSSINEHIDQMRLSATKSLMERKDVIVIASVSAIYGLGDPKSYIKMLLHVNKGDIVDRKNILKRLVEMQYTRNDLELSRGNFRVKGDVIDIFPADSDKYAIRIELFDEEVESITQFDPLTGQMLAELSRHTVYPKTHYATPRDVLLDSVDKIKAELNVRLQELREQKKLVEEHRLKQRTMYDIEMMLELGYCSGIENYSIYLSQRELGSAPPTLIDYMPKNSLLFIDESHVMVPQIGAMYKGDRSRKETLVQHGFRLPTALDNRPLKFDEFLKISPQTIFVSATPGNYELEQSDMMVEQIVRPTGLIDPSIEIRPVLTQVDDLLSEIHKKVELSERILITTLTKKMAEELTDYYREMGVKVKYLHSDINTVERIEIIKDLRLGLFDVLIGINLLREGLDMPEVSLVAILDADKEGFLRSYRSLTQTIGRAARNSSGHVILYGDKITNSMKLAIEETDRRRKKQEEYNKLHNITPKTIIKSVSDIMGLPQMLSKNANKNEIDISNLSIDELSKIYSKVEKEMLELSEQLEFEKAASLRDKLLKIEKQMLGIKV